jgi:hypothetical protein
MSTYAVVSSVTNICDNIVSWDGVTPWSPPPDHYAVEDNDGAGSIGWTYDPATGQWTAPPPPPPPPEVPPEV